MNTDKLDISQAQLDRWRAFASQTLQDVREVRRLIARGQATAADQLLGGVLESTLIAGHTMDDAGANRPVGSPIRPTGEARMAAEREANE